MTKRFNLKSAATTIVLAATFITPAVADGHIENLMGMSNNAAADVLLDGPVLDDYIGELIKLSLNNMSTEERFEFFQSDTSTQFGILAANRQRIIDENATPN